uniref:Uncharacterized protein n=1 Tax=Arundo donax TaxID=35708 RepID=A0A0A9FGU2_ARUDO
MLDLYIIYTTSAKYAAALLPIMLTPLR